MDSIVDNAIDEEEQNQEVEEDSQMEQLQESTQTQSQSDVGLDDDELEDVVEELQTNITVVGCGGAGCNTLNRMVEEGIDGANLVAVNTDAQDLVASDADTKILIGRETTGGRGAGSVPQVGEDSAREDMDQIESCVSDSDMVFITAGLGGGTGTGSAPVVAEAANNAGALTVSIVTLPFSDEGEVRRVNAEAGLERLRSASDTVIVVPNDRLLDTVGSLPLQKAFKVADEVLMRSVKGLTELITQPGLINLDFADVRTVMEQGGVAMIGLGESDSQQKASDSVQSALESPLLDVDITQATSVLVNVTGGSDMNVNEAEGVVEMLQDRVSTDARIIWGASVDEELDGTMRTMLVITGVESPQIYGTTSESEAPQNVESFEEDSQPVDGSVSDESDDDIDYIE